MAKGDVKYSTLIGAVGTATSNYSTKTPDGNFRFTTKEGISFKCGLPTITGRVQLIEDAFIDNGETKVFFRLVGVVTDTNQVALATALDGVEW